MIVCQHRILHMQVLLEEVPYFRGCSMAFLMAVAARMEEVVYAPMELAIEEGKPLTHLVVIRRGVMVAHGRVLSRGRVVGQESLYKNWPAPHSVRSMAFTEGSQLERGALLELLQQHPDMLRQFTVRSIQFVFKCAATSVHACVVCMPACWRACDHLPALRACCTSVSTSIQYRSSSMLCRSTLR